MGNYSKHPKDALEEAMKKGYDRIRFQQGKPILDRDLNLLGDLSSSQRLWPYLGNGVPTGSKAGLMADPPPDPTVVDFELQPGRCIVFGFTLELEKPVSYSAQPHQENVQTEWPFKAFSKGAKEGPGYVYLRVFLTEVDDAEDTDLQNQGDIGFETTVREKLDWELLLSDEQSTRPSYMLLAEYYVSGGVAESWRDRRLTDLTLETLRRDFDTFKSDVNTKTAMLNQSGDLAPNSVGNAQMKDNAVGTLEIQDLAVTTNKLAANAVDGTKLAPNSVGTTRLQDFSINSNKFLPNVVANNHLQDNSVTTNKLAVNAVDSTRLAPNSVVYGKVAPSSITVAQFKTLTLLNTSFSIGPSASMPLTLLPKAFVGADNFVIYTLWGDSDFTWSEHYASGNRMLKVQNNTTSTIIVNVMARLIFAN